jgi:transcription elongation factor Elf1
MFGDDPHQGLAEFAFPNGSVIECKSCDVRRDCTTQEITKWLKEGYPICKKCGQRTELQNPHVKKIEF